MQGVLTSREAWVRFACALYIDTELTPAGIAAEADQMLIEYLKRFPDPKNQKSAVLSKRGYNGEPEGMEFTLTRHETYTPSPDGGNEE
jgi:hypothetical protein